MTIEEIKDNYGFNPASQAWVPMGGELLKMIGQPMLCMECSKESGEWNTTTKGITVKSISDYDMKSMMYKVCYVVDETKEEVENLFTPEGLSKEVITNSMDKKEDTFWKLMPYSYHSALTEEMLYFARVAKMFNEKEGMTFEEVKELSELKDQNVQFKYARNIVCVVKPKDDEICAMRIGMLKFKHSGKDDWKLFVYDGDGKSIYLEVKEGKFILPVNNECEVKIFDLQGKGE